MQPPFYVKYLMSSCSVFQRFRHLSGMGLLYQKCIYLYSTVSQIATFFVFSYVVDCHGSAAPEDNDSRNQSAKDPASRTSDTLDCAFHITHALRAADLARLEVLRRSLPLDRSRPTCPRRFVTEKEIVGAEGPTATSMRRADGWIGALMDRNTSAEECNGRSVMSFSALFSCVLAKMPVS